MRKVDLLILVILCAVVAVVFRSGPPAPVASPTAPSPAQALTDSGRWEVLPGRFEAAGLPLGATKAQAQEALGIPSEKRDENKETSQWVYTSDGDAKLQLTWLEGRLILASSGGRWGLTEGGQARPGFMAGKDEILRQWGEPTRKSNLEWVYETKPGDVTFRFKGDRVYEFSMTAEIKARPILP